MGNNNNMLATFKDLRKSMNDVFDSFCPQNTNLTDSVSKMFESFSGRNYIKRVNEDGALFYVAVPGYSKEDISVEIKEGSYLSIQFKEKENIPFPQSDFFFNIPTKNTDVEKTKVKVENGMMTITVPFIKEKKHKGFSIKID